MRVKGGNIGVRQYIKDNVGRLLQEVRHIRARWMSCFDTLRNTKSAKLHPAIVDGLKQCTTSAALGADGGGSKRCSAYDAPMETW